MAMLVSASVNAAQETISLFFPGVATTTTHLILSFSSVVFVLVVMTRGRLGYSPKETASIFEEVQLEEKR